MSGRELIYLILALLGVVAGWYFNIQYYMTAGDDFGWIDWTRRCLVNPAAASALMDLTFGYIILSVWMVIEARRLGMRFGWLYIVLAVGISFAFGVGLFLMLRERRLRNPPLASTDGRPIPAR
jgi:hypothetical protein